QRSTLPRKLPIIAPTPTVTETATTRAAIATPVRDSPASRPPAAIRPTRPNAREKTGRAARARRSAAPGARSAQPTIVRKRARKLAGRFGQERRAAPESTSRAPRALARGRALRARASRSERTIAARGGVR